jgi:stage V sporulation protein B
MQLAAGAAPELASQTGNTFAGYYRAAQTFAFVPYQLILSVAFVVFPLVSEAVSMSDSGATRAYIRGAMRFSLLVLLAVAAPVAGASDGVMRIAYPDAYLAGSGALSVLSLGMVCFALFVIAATVLSGAGHPGIALAIAAGSAALVTVLNLGFVRAVGVGEHTLIAAAIATAIGTLCALLAAAIAVHRRFGAFIAPATAVRALSAAAVGAAVAYAIPHATRGAALLALIGGGVSYLAVLLLARELGRDDLARIASLVRR